MIRYTVEIQAGNEDETIWQAVAPADVIEANDDDSADDVAWFIGRNQTIADGEHWRVVVWRGEYDPTGGDVHRDPDTEVYADTYHR